MEGNEDIYSWYVLKTQGPCREDLLSIHLQPLQPCFSWRPEKGPNHSLSQIYWFPWVPMMAVIQEICKPLPFFPQQLLYPHCLTDLNGPRGSPNCNLTTPAHGQELYFISDQDHQSLSQQSHRCASHQLHHSPPCLAFHEDFSAP